jgi:hypothetical protein
MGDDQLDFELPEEVLSVIPMDPFEQLDLARKITSMAIASRVSNLDSEVVELRQKLLGKESVVRELEEKASRLERDCREADSRLKVVLEDNVSQRASISLSNSVAFMAPLLLHFRFRDLASFVC